MAIRAAEKTNTAVLMMRAMAMARATVRMTLGILLQPGVFAFLVMMVMMDDMRMAGGNDRIKVISHNRPDHHAHGEQ